MFLKSLGAAVPELRHVVESIQSELSLSIMRLAHVHPERAGEEIVRTVSRAPEYRPSLSRNRSSVRRDSLISDHRSTAMEYSTTRLFPSAALTHVSNVAAPVVPQLSDPICLQVHAP